MDEIFPLYFRKLPEGSSHKVVKLASDSVDWVKQSVLASSLVKKARVIFLWILLLTAPIAALTSMNRTYYDIKTLKTEISMDKTFQNTTSDLSADMVTLERKAELEQYKKEETI